MKRVLCLLLSLASCCIASADARGVKFVRKGLEFTIAAEYTAKRPNKDKSSRNDRDYIIVSEGEAYVSGVTVSDSAVKIPTVVTDTVRIPNDTTPRVKRYNVLGIGSRAFENVRLKNLFIPYGLKFIGESAFHNFEVTDGVLVVPPVRRMYENVFDGMKSKVFFLELADTRRNVPIPTYFSKKTFENKDDLPEFYISHSELNTPNESIDKRMLYTIGSYWTSKWGDVDLSYETIPVEKRKYYKVSKSVAAPSTGKIKNKTKTDSESTFMTCPGRVSPIITIYVAKKFEKTGTDLDLMPPLRFCLWNTYTGQWYDFEGFDMNDAIFRGRIGEEYLYFALDGKPLTDKSTLVDSNGYDPFGLQVFTPEETKTKKEAKERSKKLNKEVDSMKKMFGF